MPSAVDASINRYIASTRLGVNLDLADGLITIPKIALNFIRRLLHEGDSAGPEADVVLMASLRKFSEHVRIGERDFFLIDHFLSLQCAFLNKLYFVIPETSVIDSYTQGIAAHRALLNGFVGAAQLLHFPHFTSAASRKYVSEVKQHMGMDYIQRMFVVCHEYIHFMIRTNDQIKKDFLFFSSSFSTDEHIRAFYEVLSAQDKITTFEAFSDTMRDPRFIEEAFSDFRAANYLHLLLCHQKKILGANLFNSFEFFLAILSFHSNQNFIAAIDEMVDSATHCITKSSTGRNEKAISKRNLELNLRRIYMYRQLLRLGEEGIGTGTPQSLAEWRSCVEYCGKKVDFVAEKILKPTLVNLFDFALETAFQAALSDKDIGFPIGDLRVNGLVDSELSRMQINIAKSMVAIDPASYLPFTITSLEAQLASWRTGTHSRPE